MLSPKTKRRFIGLSIASFMLWLIGTFVYMILDHVVGGSVPVETKPTVSLRLYQDVGTLVHSIIYHAMPSLSAGYLLIGLFILLFIQKSENKDDHDA